MIIYIMSFFLFNYYCPRIESANDYCPRIESANSRIESVFSRI